MEQGFVKSRNVNLPRTDILSVMNFLIHSPLMLVLKYELHLQYTSRVFEWGDIKC